MIKARSKTTRTDLALAANGCAAFASTATPGRFAKEVLHVGTFKHPEDGQVFQFTAADLDEIAAGTNAYIASGRHVTFPAGPDCHGEDAADATKNLGHWDNFRRIGEELWADVNVEHPDVAPLVGKTIRDVSVGLFWNVETPEGGYFPAVVKHVAATPFPVVGSQKNFVQLAAGETALALAQEVSVEKNATIEDATDETELAEPAAPSDMSPKDAQKALAVLLGIDGEPKWSDMVAAVRGLCMDEGTEGDPAEGYSAATSVPLSQKVKKMRADKQKTQAENVRLSDRVSTLERETRIARERFEASEKAAVEIEIRAAKKRAADAGTPERFSKDVEDDVRAMFGQGHKDLARRTIERAFAGSVSSSVATSAGESLPNPGSADPEAKKKRDAFVASGLASKGIQVETDANGLIVRDAQGRPKVRATK